MKPGRGTGCMRCLTALTVLIPIATSSAQMPADASRYSATTSTAVPPLVDKQSTNISVNIDADMLRFTSFKRDINEQLNMLKSTADEVAPGVGAGIEVSRTDFPIYFRSEFHYAQQDFSQTYNPSGPLFPQSADGTVKGIFVDIDLGFRLKPFDTPRLSWNFYGGPTYARDKVPLTWHYSTITQMEERSVNTWKGNFGTSIHLDTNTRIGWDIVDLTYTSSFKKNDADAHFRVSSGLTFSFGPRNSF